MGWMDRLQERWNVSASQVVLILIVFACTGFTVMFLKNPILDLLIGEGERTWVASLIYYIFIIPIYNVFLLIYGFVFGQFKFFWAFEKRFFRRIASVFRKENIAEGSRGNRLSHSESTDNYPEKQ